MSPIYLGSNIVAKIYQGETEIDSLSVGSTLINFYSTSTTTTTTTSDPSNP
jgi:hypothetical protein